MLVPMRKQTRCAQVDGGKHRLHQIGSVPAERNQRDDQRRPHPERSALQSDQITQHQRGQRAINHDADQKPGYRRQPFDIDGVVVSIKLLQAGVSRKRDRDSWLQGVPGSRLKSSMTRVKSSIAKWSRPAADGV
jgi:hypothetical protein